MYTYDRMGYFNVPPAAAPAMRHRSLYAAGLAAQPQPARAFDVRALYARGSATSQPPATRAEPSSRASMPSTLGAPLPPATISPWKIGLAIGAGVVLARLLGDLMQSKREKHDALVRRIATATEREGWYVTADVRGFPKPPTVFGHRSDVHAWHPDGSERIVEVEHEDTLDAAHTGRQVAAFTRYARCGRRREFLLATT